MVMLGGNVLDAFDHQEQSIPTLYYLRKRLGWLFGLETDWNLKYQIAPSLRIFVIKP